MLTPQSPLNPKQRFLSASQFNDIVDEVKRQSCMNAVAPLEILQGGGNPTIYFNERTIYARLTDSFGGWVEVIPSGNGGWADGSRTGGGENNGAFAADGSTNIPDSYVLLHPGVEGDYVYFPDTKGFTPPLNTFWAQLVAKCYSPSEAITPGNCNAGCNGHYIAYAWRRLVERGDNNFCPVQWTLSDAGIDSKNGQPIVGYDYGGFDIFDSTGGAINISGWPAYHPNNREIPICAGPNPFIAGPGYIQDGATNVQPSAAGYTCTIPGSTTRNIWFRYFNFGLTGGSTIQNIKIKLVATVSKPGCIKDTGCQLMVGGSVGGTQHATNSFNTSTDPNSPFFWTYSDSPGGFGFSTLGPIDVNDSPGFGVAMQFQNTDGATQSINFSAIVCEITLDRGGIEARTIVRLTQAAGYNFYFIDYDDVWDIVKPVGLNGAVCNGLNCYGSTLYRWTNTNQLIQKYIVTSDHYLVEANNYQLPTDRYMKALFVGYFNDTGASDRRTATLTSGSNNVSVNSTGLAVGQPISGTGVGGGSTTITSIAGGSNIIISSNATTTGPSILSFMTKGNTTAGSPVVSGLLTTTGLGVGTNVTIGGVNTSVKSVDSSSQVTLNNNLTSTGSQVTIQGQAGNKSLYVTILPGQPTKTTFVSNVACVSNVLTVTTGTLSYFAGL